MSRSPESDEIDALRTRVAQLEEALHRSDERFRLLTTRTPTGIYHFTADGACLFVNERFSEITGLSPEEASASSWADMLTREDKARVAPAFNAALRGESPYFEAEYRIVRSDGTARWIRTAASFVFDEHGALHSYLGTVTDMTERHDAEDASRRSEERARLLSRRLPVGVFEVEFNQGGVDFSFVNDRWCDILGIPRDEARGDALIRLVHPDDVKRSLDAWRAGVASRASVSVEERVVRPDGETRWIRVTAEPLLSEEGEGFTYLGVLVDITERKRLEALLGETMAQKEIIEAQRIRLSEMSTPLIPITEEIMVMPLVGEVDPERAEQVLETLLSGVSGAGARVAILDVTGVVTMNAEVANALVRAAQAVKLLGAQAVLSGIRAEVAQTLVELDADIGGMATFSSLKAAIAYGMRAVRAGRA